MRTLVIPAAIAALSLAAIAARADESVSPANVGSADVAASHTVRSHAVHANGAQMPGGRPRAPMTARFDAAGHAQLQTATSELRVPGAPAAGAASGLPSSTFYPDDLSLATSGAPVMTTATFHNIYVNCNSRCWGQPGNFESALFDSSMIHLLDQYMGTTAGDRYSLGRSVSVSYPVGAAPLTDSADIPAIVHAAAAQYGGGYNQVYHVFLPNGVDVCFDSSYSTCYSPDNLASFSFCGYHGYVDFPDIGHVIYSVEPYQAAATRIGANDYYLCEVSGPNASTPNGVLVDSTASVLSHETFELLTDPDLDAWGGMASLPAYGYEIGDMCVNPYYYYAAPINLSGRPYLIQPEYSNRYHACTSQP